MENPSSMEALADTLVKPIKVIPKGTRRFAAAVRAKKIQARIEKQQLEKKDKLKLTKKFKTKRESVELALNALKSDVILQSNPTIDVITPTSEECKIPFSITNHRNPYSLSRVPDDHPFLFNLVYFKRSCLKDLVTGTTNRNILVSYIKNIIFLEVFHKYGMPFHNTIPVVGYGLLTNKTDIDFMYGALQILIAEGGRHRVGMIETLLKAIPSESKLKGLGDLFSYLGFISDAEKVVKPAKQIASHAKEIFAEENILLAKKYLGAESIRFQQILSIAHSVESLMILILVDLYSRIEYIETNFIYQEHRNKLKEFNKKQSEAQVQENERGSGLLGLEGRGPSSQNPLYTNEEQYNMQKAILEGKYDGAKGLQDIQKQDSKYKQFNSDIMNYYCMDLFIKPPSFRFDFNSSYWSSTMQVPYYRYPIDFSKIKFDFTDARDSAEFKTKILFPNKTYYKKAIQILEEVFLFQFKSETAPVDKTRYFPSFKLHELGEENYYLELSIQKSNITQYFEEYIEPLERMQSETLKSPNAIQLQNDPEHFIARIGTSGIEVESEETLSKGGVKGQIINFLLKDKRIAPLLFGQSVNMIESLGHFMVSAFGLQNLQELSDLVREYAQDFQIRYKKKEMVYVKYESLIEEKKQRVNNRSQARRNAGAFMNQLTSMAVEAGNLRTFATLGAVRGVARQLLPSATKEISVYTKKALPASASNVYDSDIVHDVFNARYYPKTKVPYLLDADVKYALLATAAYIPNVKKLSNGSFEEINTDMIKLIRYGEYELHYLPIFTKKRGENGLPILQERFSKHEIFQSRDFLDEEGIENIRFYYEYPNNFKQTIEKLIKEYTELETKEKTIKTIQIKLEIQEENLEKYKKYKEDLLPKQQELIEEKEKLEKDIEHLEKKLDAVSQSIEEEVKRIKSTLHDELTEQIQKIERALEKYKLENQERFQKKINKLEDTLKKSNNSHLAINELEESNSRLLNKSKALEKLTQQDKQLNTKIEEKLERLDSILPKIKKYERLISIRDSEIKKSKEELEYLKAKLKEQKVKILKGKLLSIKEALKKPFHLFIAYRGTEFDTQQIRDLFVADVLLAIGKDEYDPRFTIVNRISSNINLFREHIAETILETFTLPEYVKQYFKDEIRLQIYSTGHSLGGTLALMSTYYSYVNPIPMSLRKYVGNVILSIGFNPGAGIPIIQKFKKLPENSFRIYRNYGDIISFCFKRFQASFANARNIINVPCVNSTRLLDLIQNHGMPNFLGIVLASQIYSINLTETMVNAVTNENPLILYGEGKDNKVQGPVYQKVSIYPASSFIEQDFQAIEEKKRRYQETLVSRQREREIQQREAEERENQLRRELIHNTLAMVGGTRRHKRGNRKTRKH
jgi:hypothetical protein